MFSSLKSLKCQSNKTGVDKDEEVTSTTVIDNVSEHTYEKLPADRGIGVQVKPPRTPKLNRRLNNSKSNQQSSVQLRTKVTRVNIEREDGSLGITLRGGFHKNSELSTPLTITQVKPDGPAAKDGVIRPGDRLLAVDGISLHETTLSDAQLLLKQQTTTTTLTIEYDVSVLGSVRRATGPLLVEIEQPPLYCLGLTFYRNDDGIVIERIKPGSFADRCGALHVGDEILAINDTRLDHSSISVENVISLLNENMSTLRFEILPANATLSYPDIRSWNSRGDVLAPSTSMSALSTLKSRRRRENGLESSRNDTALYNTVGSLSPLGFYKNQLGLTYSETLHVTLVKDDDCGFGVEFIDSGNGDVLVNKILSGGPADRCGCLQPGDRILSVNHRNLSLDRLCAGDLNVLAGNIDPSLANNNTNVCNKLSLHVEFDVLESVVPASGIFIVKLAKRGSAPLGITITASKTSGFLICEMKKGSVAHRAGSLMAGDKLLSINNILLERCSLENAAQILHASNDIVTIKVQRNESYSETGTNKSIVYTVELQRYGGPLGITIAGSEEPFQPITVSGLTPGGLAEQTGALHVSDEILAINNHSLYGEPLSRAHGLLQSSPDLVTLKISRLVNAGPRQEDTSLSPVLPSSVDSAVESWDSSRLDHTPSPDRVQVQETDQPECVKPEETSSTTTSTIQRHSDKEKSPNLAIFDEITSENLKIKQELDQLSNKLNKKLLDTPSKDGVTNVKVYTVNGGASCGGGGRVRELETFKQTSRDEVCCGDCVQGEEPTTGADVVKDMEAGVVPCHSHWYTQQCHLHNGVHSNHDVSRELTTSHLHKVTLFKDPIYEDFGFSVSDGLYEKGVFINRIRKGGPADLSNVLKPYDRILQVNDTYTHDFDCCLTVPLIAAAENRLTLMVARSLIADHIQQDYMEQSDPLHHKILV